MISDNGVASANGILYQDSTIKILSNYIVEYETVLALLDLMYTRLCIYSYQLHGITDFNGYLQMFDILPVDGDERYLRIPEHSTDNSIGTIFYVLPINAGYGFYTKIYYGKSNPDATDPRNTLYRWTQPDIMSNELYERLLPTLDA